MKIMPMSEKGGVWQIPLVIDLFGGVLKQHWTRKSREVGLRVRTGGNDFSVFQELDGYDWALACGEASRGWMVSACGEYVTTAFQTPHMRILFDRETGDLAIVTLSGLDLVYLAGMKMALATGDAGKMGELKTRGEDRAICLSFTDGPRLTVAEIAGSEYRPVETVDGGKLMNKFGLLPGKPHCAWNGTLGFLRGRVGMEMFADSITFYYEHKGVRQNVVEFPRVLTAAIGFDGLASNGLPSEVEIEEFLEKVYVPLI